MKTQILRLDPHDDLNSTRDKMNWGQTGRILLVWPEHSRMLRRRVDLILLQRQSTALGAQLALVSNDPVVHFNAHLLSIPIFKNLRQAQSAHWRIERRRRVRLADKTAPRKPRAPQEIDELREGLRTPTPLWLEQPAPRLGIFTLGVLAVLALAAVLLPGAEVTLSPKITVQELALTVRANPAQQNINLSGVLPAHALTSVVEGRDILEASGVTRVPDRAASGQVVFTNLSDRPIEVPVGLVVRSPTVPTVRFGTLQSVELAAGPGITATLSVRAMTPGEIGNLPLGSLTAIEGNLGTSLAVTNPRPTRGGSDRNVPLPTKNDRQRLYEKLENALRDSALEELKAQLNPGDLLFTPTLTVTQVMDVSYLPAEDQPSGQLQLSLRLEYQAYSATQDDLASLIRVLLDANLPEGYTPLPESLSIKSISAPAIDTGNIAQWRISASRNLQASIQPEKAINLILGSNPVQAATRLDTNFLLQGPPVIRLTPSWWPRLPILPFRISVIL